MKENIYSSPESDVQINEKIRPKRKLVWKIFFWFNIAVAMLLPLAFFMFEAIEIIDIVDLIIYPFTLVALFGYAYTKKIFTKKLWEILAIIYPLWFIFYEFTAPFALGMPSYGEAQQLDMWILLSFVFGIPTILCLYFYSFKSSEVWHKTNDQQKA